MNSGYSGRYNALRIVQNIEMSGHRGDIFCFPGRGRWAAFGLTLLCWLILSPAVPAEAPEKIPENFSLDGRRGRAAPMNGNAVILDGLLDEEVWGQAPLISGFIQQQPEEGAPASEKTEIRLLYSRNDLYVGVQAFDSEPEKIRALLSRRDSMPPSDWIRIYIDSYYDHRSAFEFAVNPAGVKRDVFWSNDRRPDDDWDAVWDVAVTRDHLGWSAEFRIPFSQIRFPRRSQQVWGFQAARVIARRNETSHWSRIPRGVPQFCSLFGILTGIYDIPAPQRLQVVPYALGLGAFEPKEAGNPFQTGRSFLSNAGLDVKYGLTSNLTLDATFNPDFGQVEADPADVNLTAYETYFSEKRPFFMEGGHMLNSQIGSGYDRESLFYSRRIGRQPQGSVSDALFSCSPDAATILGAAKLTGKTAGGWSIGLLEAVTGREQADVVNLENGREKQVVEPSANYLLGKLEKEFRNGRSALGIIMTAVNRNIQDQALDFLRSAAYSGGLSVRHRWGGDAYEMKGSLLGSHLRGSEEAIEGVQTSSAHYFQRPDAEHLDLDPTRTSLTGSAGSLSFSKIGGGCWRWSVSARTRSPGFEVNDMGYMKEADSIIQSNWLSYHEYRPGPLFRDYEFSMSYWNSWDFGMVHESTGLRLRSEFRLLNYWQLEFGANRNTQRRSSSHLRGGPSVLIPGDWSLSGQLRTDSRRPLYLHLRSSVNLADNDADTFSLSSGVTIRASDRLDLSLSPSLSDSCRRLQYIDSLESEMMTHYLLGRIDQTTVALTLRLNYTVRPNLSLQLYSQPFISAGIYQEFKEVTHPLAAAYDDRWHIYGPDELILSEGTYLLSPANEPTADFSFSDPNFNYRQFRLNLVVRWEYLPGSTMYVVWTNGMNDSISRGTLELGEDLRELFSAASNNIFLVKFSYWFSL